MDVLKVVRRRLVLEVLVQLGAFVHDGAARRVCGPAAAGRSGVRRPEEKAHHGQSHFSGYGACPLQDQLPSKKGHVERTAVTRRNSPLACSFRLRFPPAFPPATFERSSVQKSTKRDLIRHLKNRSRRSVADPSRFRDQKKWGGSFAISARGGEFRSSFICGITGTKAVLQTVVHAVSKSGSKFNNTPTPNTVSL